MRNKKQKKSNVQDLYTRRALTYESLYVKRLGWGQEVRSFFTYHTYLQPHVMVLDAGCGTGVITRTLRTIANEKEYEDITFHAFDLTQGMLDVFHEQMAEEPGSQHIELAQGDVLKLDSLPAGWHDYDLIISSALLEYIPEEQIHHALSNLKQLLKDEGKLIIFLTRKKFVTNLAGKLWWKTNLFEEEQFRRTLQDVGFKAIEQRPLPSKWSKFIMAFEVRK